MKLLLFRETIVLYFKKSLNKHRSCSFMLIKQFIFMSEEYEKMTENKQEKKWGISDRINQRNDRK